MASQTQIKEIIPDILPKIYSISEKLTKFGNVTVGIDDNFREILSSCEKMVSVFTGDIQTVTERIQELENTYHTDILELRQAVNYLEQRLSLQEEKIENFLAEFKGSAQISSLDSLVSNMIASPSSFWQGKTVQIIDSHNIATQYVLTAPDDAVSYYLERYNTSSAGARETIRARLANCWHPDNIYHDDSVPDTAKLNVNLGYLVENGFTTKNDFQNKTFTEILRGILFKEVYFNQLPAYGGKWSDNNHLKQNPATVLNTNASIKYSEYYSNYAGSPDSYVQHVSYNNSFDNKALTYGKTWAEAQRYGYIELVGSAPDISAQTSATLVTSGSLRHIKLVTVFNVPSHKYNVYSSWGNKLTKYDSTKYWGGTPIAMNAQTVSKDDYIYIGYPIYVYEGSSPVQEILVTEKQQYSSGYVLNARSITADVTIVVPKFLKFSIMVRDPVSGNYINVDPAAWNATAGSSAFSSGAPHLSGAAVTSSDPAYSKVSAEGIQYVKYVRRAIGGSGTQTYKIFASV